MKPWVPLTYEAFCDYQLDTQLLSSKAISIVRTLVAGRQEEAEALKADSGMAGGEWLELMDALGLK